LANRDRHKGYCSMITDTQLGYADQRLLKRL
jgi:hypothetical protein